MRARLVPGRPVAPAWLRLLRRLLRQGIAICEPKALPSLEAVHELRRIFKRSRALLRLGADLVGRGRARKADRALRDLHRRLGALRDADAAVTTLRELAGGLVGLRADLCLRLAESLRRGARRRQAAAEAAALLPGIAAGLRTVLRRTDTWMPCGGFAVLADALRRSWREARRGLREARRSDDPEVLHAWRKQVKTLALQTAPLRALWTADGEDDLPQALRRIGSLLGTDHDLAVLCDLAEASLPRPQARVLIQAAGSRRRLLHREAIALGRAVLKPSPEGFAREVRRRWRQR